MSEWITPGKTIGIIGGGKIARQMAVAARKLGYHIAILDPRQDCPAAELAEWMIQAEYLDEKAVMELAFKCDAVLYESEEAYADVIERVQRTVVVPQGEQLLSVAQDRTLQKAYLESLSINIAPFATIVTKEDIKEAISGIGFPCVLKPNQADDKTIRPLVLQDESDIDKSDALLRRGTCVLEAWIPFERELCAVGAKDINGKVIQLALSETVYKRSRLYQSFTPARIQPEVAEEVERIVTTFAEQTLFQGVFSVELFVTSTGTLYVNGILPSPHPSADYTESTLNLSQYEAHIRAVCGWPLPDTKANTQTVMMPFYSEHFSKINKQIQLKPEWKFAFHGHNQPDEPAGYVTIPTENLPSTLDVLSDINLWDER